MCPTQLKKRGIEVPESLDFVSPSKEPPGKRRKCKEQNEVIYLPPTRLSHVFYCHFSVRTILEIHLSFL